jgi:ribosomal protein S24E
MAESGGSLMKLYHRPRKACVIQAIIASTGKNTAHIRAKIHHERERKRRFDQVKIAMAASNL